MGAMKGVDRLLFLCIIWNTVCGLQQPRCHLQWTHPEELNDSLKSLWRDRGGARNWNGHSDIIELNPEYHRYTPPLSSYLVQSLSKEAKEHEAWLNQQQQQQQQQQQYHQTGLDRQCDGFNFSARPRNPSNWMHQVHQHFVTLYSVSPSLYWTTVSCIGVFGLWQIPKITGRPVPFLYQFFINSQRNTIKTGGLSLVLAAISHESFYHLLANLFSLSHLGPSVARLLKQQRTSRMGIEGMLPLLLSSAIVSNIFYLVGSARGASSLGLSGVTMSLLAIQALAVPSQVFGMVVGVIPVSLQARYILPILLVSSLAGSFVPNSRVAHLSHLGGLLYGILYYKVFLTSSNDSRRKMFQ